MRQISKTLIRSGIVGLLAASALSAQTGVAPQQIALPCIAIDYVGAEPGKPFTADYISRVSNDTSGVNANTTEVDDLVARDSSGRIRFEKHVKLPDDAETRILTSPDGGKLTVTNKLLKTLITIHDCFNGKTVSIQPGMQIAWVKETGGPPAPRQRIRPYRSLASTLLGRKLPPDLIVEDLGYKEIEGVMAHGIKVTNLGGEKDGEWSGKPMSVNETWEYLKTLRPQYRKSNST